MPGMRRLTVSVAALAVLVALTGPTVDLREGGLAAGAGSAAVTFAGTLDEHDCRHVLFDDNDNNEPVLSDEIDADEHVVGVIFDDNDNDNDNEGRVVGVVVCDHPPLDNDNNH
jgi:hypothetical protein